VSHAAAAPMALTAAEIARARHVCLMITSRDKLATIENAMADSDSDLPIVRLAEMLLEKLDIYGAK
jgi:6-phosphogluconolactonase/glucosamine-6-phosphate isomerase/deaminase